MKTSSGQKSSSGWREGGAYILVLEIERNVELQIGSLGRYHLSRGFYIYIGSARRGIQGRLERHRRISHLKCGPIHWHIDAVLNNPFAELVDAFALPGTDECTVSTAIRSEKGIEVPVPGFGASDCRSGCPAHLYRLPQCFKWSKWLHAFSVNKGVSFLQLSQILSPGNLLN